MSGTFLINRRFPQVAFGTSGVRALVTDLRPSSRKVAASVCGALNSFALPTRDALLPMLSLLVRSARSKCSISSLIAELPGHPTYSDRIKNFPSDRFREFLGRLASDAEWRCKVAGKDTSPAIVDLTDGVRMTFADGDIVHLRASVKTPELCRYAEAASLEVAKILCTSTLGWVQ